MKKTGEREWRRRGRWRYKKRDEKWRNGISDKSELTTGSSRARGSAAAAPRPPALGGGRGSSRVGFKGTFAHFPRAASSSLRTLFPGFSRFSLAFPRPISDISRSRDRHQLQFDWRMYRVDLLLIIVINCDSIAIIWDKMTIFYRRRFFAILLNKKS